MGIKICYLTRRYTLINSNHKPKPGHPDLIKPAEHHCLWAAFIDWIAIFDNYTADANRFLLSHALYALEKCRLLWVNHVIVHRDEQLCGSPTVVICDTTTRVPDMSWQVLRSRVSHNPYVETWTGKLLGGREEASCEQHPNRSSHVDRAKCARARRSINFLQIMKPEPARHGSGDAAAAAAEPDMCMRDNDNDQSIVLQHATIMFMTKCRFPRQSIIDTWHSLSAWLVGSTIMVISPFVRHEAPLAITVHGVDKCYDTIRDAILTCARKPTWVSFIYRTENDN